MKSRLLLLLAKVVASGVVVTNAILLENGTDIDLEDGTQLLTET